MSEYTLRSRTSLLPSLGFEGEALSQLVVRQPSLLKISEEKVIELFKQIENLGLKKGSKLFAVAACVILGQGKETLERKLQCLRSLGFSEKQISELSCRRPRVLEISEEKLKRNVDYVVNSVGLLLADLLKYPQLFDYSLEKRILPRCRVMEALKSMPVQEWKRDISLPAILCLAENRFLERYVNKNPESSILLDIYHSGNAAKVINNKETHDDCVLSKEIQGSSGSSSGLST